MIYAPVLIPTLNRYEHLKETITSLSHCTGAEFTDLYIALDYPPSAYYEEGYKKIVNFLPSISGFKSVNIIRRDHNFGVGKNALDALVNIVFKEHDRYIFSEDDNHFSPNFLEFMNKGFEIFKGNKSVIAINGYRHFYDLIFADNNYFFQTIDFSAWGYGMMRETRITIGNIITKKYFRKKFLNPINWWRVGRNGLNRFLQFLYFALGSYKKPTITDGTLSIYMALNNLKVVMPKVSKVRNIGWDSLANSYSGNMRSHLSEKYNHQVIDTESTFEYMGDGYSFFSENRRAYKKETLDRLTTWSFFKIIGKKLLRVLEKHLQFS